MSSLCVFEILRRTVVSAYLKVKGIKFGSFKIVYVLKPWVCDWLKKIDYPIQQPDWLHV